MIDASNLAEVILNIVVYYHGFLSLVITNNGIFYLLKTCHCYTNSIAFYLQNQQPYQKVEKHFESTFNPKTFYTYFELNYDYYLCVSYKNIFTIQFFTSYYRSSTYQKKAGIQKYITNAIRELRKWTILRNCNLTSYISNSTYYLLIYLGLVHLIKSYNY